MKLRSVIAVLLICAIFALCGCSAEETYVLDKTKVPVNYTAEYAVSTEASNAPNGELSYTNTYTVTINEAGEFNIASIADEPWDNGKTDSEYLEGRQIITTLSRLQYADNGIATFGMPLYIEQEFKVTADESYYTHFTYAHDHEKLTGTLNIKEYSDSSETGYKETLHAISLKKQYFDKDTIAFILAAFPEECVTGISSGNRDSIQTVKIELLTTEDITTDAGTFTCNRYRIRPNTAFSVNSANIWVDSITGIPVRIQHDSSVSQLKSYTVNE